MNHSHISTKSFSNCVAKKGPRSETVTLCWGDGYQALTWVCSSGNKKWRKMIQDTSSYWKWLTIWSFVFVILVCTPKATWTFAWQFNGSFSRKWWFERKCGRLGGCFLAIFENWDVFFKCSEVFLAILCYLPCVFLFRFGFCSAEKLLFPSMRAVGMCLGLSEGSVELSCWSTKACIKGHLPIVKILLEAILFGDFWSPKSTGNWYKLICKMTFEIICWKRSNQKILDRNSLR